MQEAIFSLLFPNWPGSFAGMTFRFSRSIFSGTISLVDLVFSTVFLSAPRPFPLPEFPDPPV
jgi:hypothetical protein